MAGIRAEVVPLGDLARLSVDTDAVALTFDDGFDNFASDAVPLLFAHDLAATLFVVTDQVGGTNAWSGRPAARIPTLPLLDWPALERLAAGGFSLGAHTRTHRDLTNLSPAAIDDEVAGSVECLRQRLGITPCAFAYPCGRMTPAVIERVAASFAWGCTTDHRPFRVAEQPLVLPRLDILLPGSGTPRGVGHVGIQTASGIHQTAASLRSLPAAVHRERP